VSWPTSAVEPTLTVKLGSSKPKLEVMSTPTRMTTNATWATTVPNGANLFWSA